MHTVLSPSGTRGRTRLLLGLVPVMGVLAAVPFWYVWERGYWLLVAEDRLVEYLTFSAYLPAAVLALVVARRLHRRSLRVESALFVVLALAMVFIAGEEISWGQRLLGFGTPDVVLERNRQGEFTLHNTWGHYTLHGAYMVIALYGALVGRWLVPRLPRLGDRPWLFAPQADLAPWFAPCFAYYAWYDLLNPLVVSAFGPSVGIQELTGPKLQESAELALAVGVLLFVARLAARPRPDEPGDGAGSTDVEERMESSGV